MLLLMLTKCLEDDQLFHLNRNLLGLPLIPFTFNPGHIFRHSLALSALFLLLETLRVALASARPLDELLLD